jgi:integrase
LQKDVFPHFGNTPIEEITPPIILKVLRVIEKRGAYVIASKVLQRITAVLRYAVQTGLITSNPATEMKGVLKTRKVKHQPALKHTELPKFLQQLSKSDLHPTTQLALKFTILTAGRTGEIRGAKWSEIDFERALWEIPAKRMKMDSPHTVPLSQQSIAILKRIGAMWGETGFIFKGIRQESKQLSENTMLYAMYRLGYHGKATVHGFRATFSTIANESGFESDIIEKSLAHEERNAVRKAYNRSEYIEQRRKLMQWWADLLDQLEHGAEIIPFRAISN